MKKNLFKLLILSLFAFALVGCNSGVSEANVSEHGIQVRSLGAGTDGDGHEYKTYSYVVVPSNSTTPIAASVTFADSRANGSDYLTATVDNSIKEFTITCIDPFDSQATVRIYATIGSAYANVTVDYRQKLVTSTFSSGFTVGNSSTTALYWSDFSANHVSLIGNPVYTIPETFTYQGLKSYTLASGSDKPDIQGYSTNPHLFDELVSMRNDLETLIGTWLSYSIKGSQGDQQDKDLFTYVHEFLNNLSSDEKNAIGSAVDNGLITISFKLSSMESYFSSKLVNDLSFASTNRTFNFVIPSAVYQTYGVFSVVESISPDTSSIEF